MIAASVRRIRLDIAGVRDWAIFIATAGTAFVGSAVMAGCFVGLAWRVARWVAL